MGNKKSFEEEEQKISPRNRKRKKEPKFPEFQEYYKKRLREENLITAEEVSDMFKDALKIFLKVCFNLNLKMNSDIQDMTIKIQQARTIVTVHTKKR